MVPYTSSENIKQKYYWVLSNLVKRYEWKMEKKKLQGKEKFEVFLLPRHFIPRRKMEKRNICTYMEMLKMQTRA